jgi:opacity protein-like surface antigen
MRIVLTIAVACVAIAGPALAQDWRHPDGYSHARHRHGDEQAFQPTWREPDVPTQHWSQFYGRSYSDGDLWTPNSANGS